MTHWNGPFSESGDLETAESTHCLDEHEANVLFLRSKEAIERRDWETAHESITDAIAIDPTIADYHAHLAFLLRTVGRPVEALRSYRDAARLDPSSSVVHNGIGLVYRELHSLEESLASFDRAITCNPNCADAYCNRGVVLFALEQYEDAIASYRHALRIDPDSARTLNNLGNSLKALGQLQSAVDCYRRALHIQPDLAEAHCNLGNTLQALGKLEQAISSYECAVEIRPGFASAHRNLANVLEHQERFEEASVHHQQALLLEPDPPLRRLRALTMCPTVFRDVAAIAEYRRRLAGHIQRLADTRAMTDLAEILQFGCAPPFNLMYHGLNDRPLKEGFARLFAASFPEAENHPRNGLPRIGFVVTCGHQRAFVRCMGDIVQRINKCRFEIVIVCPAGALPYVRQHMAGRQIRLLVIPERIDRAAETVRSARFDLLYYWEVGTDRLNYFLPFFRLAPVQCSSWGMPVTSGIPNLDYHLSSELLEPERYEAHYSEQIVLLRTLPTYQRLQRPNRLEPRSAFGLPNDHHIYLCAQHPGKIHPDFDQVLANILRRDATGTVVMIDDAWGYASARLKSRFDLAMPDVSRRVVFVERQREDQYRSLIAIADVILDTPHYCGVMTTYDALSACRPIVTLPGKFQRSRYTAACLKKMELPNLIAADEGDYVDLAVWLGRDADLRRAVSEQIQATRTIVFEDTDAVREHERLFQTLLQC